MRQRERLDPLLCQSLCPHHVDLLCREHRQPFLSEEVTDISRGVMNLPALFKSPPEGSDFLKGDPCSNFLILAARSSPPLLRFFLVSPQFLLSASTSSAVVAAAKFASKASGHLSRARLYGAFASAVVGAEEDEPPLPLQTHQPPGEQQAGRELGRGLVSRPTWHTS